MFSTTPDLIFFAQEPLERAEPAVHQQVQGRRSWRGVTVMADQVGRPRPWSFWAALVGNHKSSGIGFRFGEYYCERLAKKSGVSASRGALRPGLCAKVPARRRENRASRAGITRFVRGVCFLDFTCFRESGPRVRVPLQQQAAQGRFSARAATCPASGRGLGKAFGCAS